PPDLSCFALFPYTTLFRSLEARLWDAADELRANSTLRASDYSVPVLGLLFLRFAEVRYVAASEELSREPGSARRTVGPVDFKARDRKSTRLNSSTRSSRMP